MRSEEYSLSNVRIETIQYRFSLNRNVPKFPSQCQDAQRRRKPRTRHKRHDDHTNGSLSTTSEEETKRERDEVNQYSVIKSCSSYVYTNID